MTVWAARLRATLGGLLGTKAVALALYALLVVLPTMVFGGLHWHQLRTDHEQRRAQLPARTRTLALNLSASIHDRLEQLIRTEEEREWYKYRNEFYVPAENDQVPFLPSPLVSEPRPEGVEAWYTYPLAEGLDAEIAFFGGSDARGARWDDEVERLRRLLRHVIREENTERREIVEYYRMPGFTEVFMPAPVVGVNLSPERDPDCLRQSFADLGELYRMELYVEVWKFHLRLLREDDGRLRLLATRRVDIPRQIDADVAASLPECYAENGFDTILVQGFFIDPDWFFRRVPLAAAERVLDESVRLYLPSDPLPEGVSREHLAGFDLVDEYNVEVQHREDAAIGQIGLRMDRSAIETAFRRTTVRFLGVAAMMIVSLALGMWLLVRSVQQSLAEARRTENFVAAVTHELRTPLAAVKMYGEMLQDGWVEDRAKQADYLARILRETNRLDALVDRVIEKRRLAARPPEPVAGDLGAIVRERVADLSLAAGTYRDDVAFEIEPGLPPVKLVPENVHAILANLVENARKYAPVDPSDPAAEPILVRVRRLGRRVVLEVLDRGPGIPEAERARVFHAFYRIGDERTRKTAGTGLGLHLVWLQAKAMRARVTVLDRKGGGALFRITFRTLRASARPAASPATERPAEA